ncbi:MAG: orotidine 5'-phosphate decarboxylase [Candidatus Vogelbacteria bacterium]|nr:orotidine 5'-phosphate decarboxylase [Candidatus Vogelbacteria bacterium]
MNKIIPLSKRLIVGADFNPADFGGKSGVRKKVLDFARELAEFKVVIKVNSILRACGYDLIEELHALGLEVMADLKLIDIEQTMSTDAALLLEYKPEMVTAMCSAGPGALWEIQQILGGTTKVMGVSVLTSLDDKLAQIVHGSSLEADVLKFAWIAQLANLPNLVCSSVEAEFLAKLKYLNLEYDTPAIRPLWDVAVGDQNAARVKTPEKAILGGADRVIVSRPITGAKPNSDGKPGSPAAAVEATLREIDGALEKLQEKAA